MRMPHPLHLDALDVMKEITLDVNVNFKVRNLWRVRLGMMLVGLACRVLRCSLVVEDHGGDDDGR